MCRDGAQTEDNVAQRHQYRPGDYRNAVAQQAIGKQAAKDRRDVNQRGIGAIKADSAAIGITKLMSKIENK
ncbi:hypothetical protein D3C71_1865870 [compost metagenome]